MTLLKNVTKYSNWVTKLLYFVTFFTDGFISDLKSYILTSSRYMHDRPTVRLSVSRETCLHVFIRIGKKIFK